MEIMVVTKNTTPSFYQRAKDGQLELYYDPTGINTGNWSTQVKAKVDPSKAMQLRQMILEGKTPFDIVKELDLDVEPKPADADYPIRVRDPLTGENVVLPFGPYSRSRPVLEPPKSQFVEQG